MGSLKHLKTAGHHRVTKGHCRLESRKGSYLTVQVLEGDILKRPVRPFHLWALTTLISAGSTPSSLSVYSASSSCVHVSPCSLLTSELIRRSSQKAESGLSLNLERQMMAKTGLRLLQAHRVGTGHQTS